MGSEPSPALSVLSLDALVAPENPIQFDIISPVSEETSGQSKTAAQSGRCGGETNDGTESLCRTSLCLSDEFQCFLNVSL